MNKKTYILGVLAVVVLAGIVWHAGKNQDRIDSQVSSILSSGQKQDISVQKVTGDLILGSPEAPVTIIEYSSHLCIYCIDFHRDTLPLLMEKYIKTGQVKIIVRFVSPLEMGLAVICAQEEGKFSEMSEYLFENIQKIQSVEDIRMVAETLGLNQENFNQCFDSQRYENTIQEWFDQAVESGVEGTPTFFIGDQRIVGNQPYLIFEEAIEKVLGESK